MKPRILSSRRVRQATVALERCRNGQLFAVVIVVLLGFGFGMPSLAAETKIPPLSDGGYGTVFVQGDITVSSETPVSLDIAAADLHFIDFTVAGDVTSASLTVQGLSPSTLYYVYLDDLHNLTTYTSTDDGGLTLSFALVKAIPELPNLRHIIIQDKPSTLFLKDDTTGGRLRIDWRLGHCY